MKATIAKTFTFDAAHRLTTLPEDHKCHRLHGHTYRVTLVLVGEVQSNGFVLDYADIAAGWAKVAELVDHQFLNEVPGLSIPSTEVLTVWIIDKLIRLAPDVAKLLAKVRVEESSTTWCEMSSREALISLREGEVPRLPGDAR